LGRGAEKRSQKKYSSKKVSTTKKENKGKKLLTNHTGLKYQAKKVPDARKENKFVGWPSGSTKWLEKTIVRGSKKTMIILVCPGKKRGEERGRGSW